MSSNEELFVVEDTELNKMLAQVAEEAYPYVIEAYQELLSEVRLTRAEWEAEETGEEEVNEYNDLYLYVYETGLWVIDAPEYLQDHRNIVSCALVGPYVNVDTLRYELEG